MSAGEQLRSLYIDIEANSDEAISEIETVSEVADSAAESFKDLASASTIAGEVLDYVGSEADNLSNELNQATASALGLNSALRSLPEEITDYEMGDIESPTLPEQPTRESQSVGFEGPEVEASTIAGLIALQDRIGEVDDSAIEATVGLNRYASQADEAGDESLTAATKVQTLDTALAGLGGGSGLGSTSAGMSAILLGATALLPAILALGTAFGGLAVAALGAASVLGGALAGGFMGLSEQVGGTQALLTEFKDALDRALQPLQQPIFQQFALDVLQGAVRLTRQFAEFAAQTFRELQPLVDVVAGAFWDNTPEFFSALNYAATELAPVLADLMVWVANTVPEGIRYLTDVTKELVPVITDVADSVAPLIPELVELGVITAQVLGPALALLVDGLTAVLTAFNALPDSLQGGIIFSAAAILGVVTALNLLSSVVMGVVGVYQSYLTVTWGLRGAQQALAGSTAASTAATYANATASKVAYSAKYALSGAIAILQSAYWTLTGAISSSTAASYARLAATKAVSAVMYAAAGARYVLSAAYGVLTGAISAATIAEYAFLAPILLVIGAIGVVIGLIYAYTENMWGLKDSIDAAIGSLIDFADGLAHAVLNPLETLRDTLEWLSDLEAIEVVVDLVQKGWNWATPDTGKEQQREFLQIADKKQDFTVEQKQKITSILETDRKTPGVRPRFAMGSQDKSEEGKKTGTTFAAGLMTVDIASYMGSWLSGIKSFMPSSDAEKGPLSNLTSWGQSLGETLISGLEKTPLGRMASQALGGLQSAFGDAKEWASGLFEGSILPQNLSMPDIPDMPDLSMPEVSMPDIPEVSMPEVPELPSMGELAPGLSMPDVPEVDMPEIESLTPGLDLPSGVDIRSAMPDIPSAGNLTAGVNMPDVPEVAMPSLGELAPSVAMPDMPEVDLPEVGNLTAGIDTPSMADIQGTMPSLGDIGHSIESTLGVSLPDTGPLLSAGSHLRNQLASGGQDIASAVTNADVGSIGIPSVDEAISAGSNLMGDIGSLGESLIGSVGPTPATTTTNRSIDKSTTDRSLNPSVKQEFTVEVHETDNPQEVRKEIENASSAKAVEGIAGALQKENN